MIAPLLAIALSASPAPARCVDIAEVSDVHGHTGQLPVLAAYVDALRARGPTILVDGGDIFQGTLESNMSKGKAMIAAYDVIGFTLGIVGNHEFDFGIGELEQRMNEASFPLLAANVVEKATGRAPKWRGLAPRMIVRLPGAPVVGFVGLATHDTPSVTLPENVKTLDFTDEAKATVEQAALLRREGAEVVIGVAHVGGRCRDNSSPDDLSSCEQDSSLFQLVRALPKGTVDGFIGGHTHAYVAHRVNGVPTIESGANGAALGWLTACAGAPVQLHPPTKLVANAEFLGKVMAPEARVAAALAPYDAAAKAELERPLGVTLAQPLTRDREAESPFGAAAAQSLRQAAHADFGLVNAGGLRIDLPAGPVRFGEVYEAMPFDNRLAVITLGGAELQALLHALDAGGHGFPQVAGLEVKPTGVFTCGGQPLDVHRTYTLATNEFVASGGDGVRLVLSQLPKGAVDVRPDPVRDYFVTYLERTPPAAVGAPCP